MSERDKMEEMQAASCMLDIICDHTRYGIERAKPPWLEEGFDTGVVLMVIPTPTKSLGSLSPLLSFFGFPDGKEEVVRVLENALETIKDADKHSHLHGKTGERKTVRNPPA